MTKHDTPTPEETIPVVKPIVCSIRLVGGPAKSLRDCAERFDETATDVVETILADLDRQVGVGIDGAFAAAKKAELDARYSR